MIFRKLITLLATVLLFITVISNVTYAANNSEKFAEFSNSAGDAKQRCDWSVESEARQFMRQSNIYSNVFASRCIDIEPHPDRHVFQGFVRYNLSQPGSTTLPPDYFYTQKYAVMPINELFFPTAIKAREACHYFLGLAKAYNSQTHGTCRLVNAKPKYYVLQSNNDVRVGANNRFVITPPSLPLPPPEEEVADDCVVDTELLLSRSVSAPAQGVGARIYGGGLAVSDIKSVTVLVADNENEWCGGTVIDSRWILTAAHCVDGKREDDIRVLSKLSSSSEGDSIICEHPIGIENILVHPDYDFNTDLSFDVALLKLKEPIDQPSVRLYSGRSDLVGKKAIAAGWGVTETGKTSGELKQITMPVVADSECIAHHFANHSTPSTLVNFLTAGGGMCAGYRSSFLGTCAADSGGPLLITVKGQLIQVGSHSYAIGNAGDPCSPGYKMFVRTSDIIPFIAQHVSGAKYYDKAVISQKRRASAATLMFQMLLL